MRIKYYPSRLSYREQAILEMVLIEELDVQSWFTVACSNVLQEEFVIVIQ